MLVKFFSLFQAKGLLVHICSLLYGKTSYLPCAISDSGRPIIRHIIRPANGFLSFNVTLVFSAFLFIAGYNSKQYQREHDFIHMDN